MSRPPFESVIFDKQNCPDNFPWRRKPPCQRLQHRTFFRCLRTRRDGSWTESSRARTRSTRAASIRRFACATSWRNARTRAPILERRANSPPAPPTKGGGTSAILSPATGGAIAGGELSRPVDGEYQKFVVEPGSY